VLFIALAWETLFLARSPFTVCRRLQMSKFTLLLGLQFLLLALVALSESRRAGGDRREAGAVDSPAIGEGAQANQGEGTA